MVEQTTATTEQACDCAVIPESRRVTWPVPMGSVRQREHQTHLWAFSLDVADDELERLFELLAPEEKQRARRFRFDLHRNRFVAGRGQLRLLLSQYTGTEPGKIQFDYGPNGKPELSPAKCSQPPCFNLAHSAELALLAVNRDVPVGVDIEELHPLEDAPALVARFFSERENSEFQRLRENQKLTAFFNLWTRKEAWLKATGEGIGYSLNKVEVSFMPDEDARLYATPEPTPVTDWQLTSLKPATGFVAALALPDAENFVATFQFVPSAAEQNRFFIE